MPRGEVIAVKPMGFADDSEQLHASSAESSLNYARSSDVAQSIQGNIVFIKVPPQGNTDRIVWYEDVIGTLKINDEVDLDYELNNSKKIIGAKNVVKVKSNIPAVPKGILPQIALLASALLILAVALDKKS